MKLSGGCHCGAVRYELDGKVEHAGLCHCSDCRGASGAPMVAWAMLRDENFTVTQGKAVTRNSAGASMRSFCGQCGTGLWYHNEEYLPGMIDVQIATLDDPEAVPPEAHIQVAERIGWMKAAHSLPQFDRFPE